MEIISSHRANGKLLLTAEYLVLDGAPAIALPTKYGQTMEVCLFESGQEILRCESVDEQGQIWFEADFDLGKMDIVFASDQEVADRFLSLLQFIREKNPSIFDVEDSLLIKNTIDFNRQWGLGTSSTLIHNLSTWAEVDPYELLEHSFGGSGYDLACAAAKGPIEYRRNSPPPRFASVSFDPPFKDDLYFVYLGKKQNSREGIKNYRAQKLGDKIVHATAEVTELNDNILSAKTLADFEESIEEHEDIISNIIGMPKVKDLYFQDHEGVVKSLGAWGGDFVLMTHTGEYEDLKKYCQLKGFEVVIPYKEMIL